MKENPLEKIDKALKEKLSMLKTDKQHEDFLSALNFLTDNVIGKVTQIRDSISNIKIDVPKVTVPDVIVPPLPEIKVPEVVVNVPEIKLPKFEFTVPPAPKAEVSVNIPPIKVPKPEVTVNYKPPTINIPEIEMPDEMNIRGWVSLMGVDLEHPLPVQIRDADGKPMNLLDGLTKAIGGMTVGGTVSNVAKIVKVSGVIQTVGVVSINPDGSSVSSTTGLTDTELRASHIDVQQVSGSIDSVNVIGTLTVNQLSGSVWSVFATNPVAQGDVATALRVVIAGNSDASVSATQVNTWEVRQVSGAIDSVSVTNTVSTKSTSSTSATSSVTVTTSSTQILASNTDRLGATIFNEAGDICYMKLGTTASLTSYTTQIAIGAYYQIPFGYTGRIDGISPATDITLRVTELT
jgi:hypothetical protein